MDGVQRATAERALLVRMPAAMHEVLRQQAFQRRIPMAALVRFAVERFLKEPEAATGHGDERPSSVQPLTGEAFQEGLAEAYLQLRRQEPNDLIPLWELYARLADRIDPESFKKEVWALVALRRAEGWFLVYHNHPAKLTPAQRALCIDDALVGQVYAWIRWHGPAGRPMRGQQPVAL